MSIEREPVIKRVSRDRQDFFLWKYDKFLMPSFRFLVAHSLVVANGGKGFTVPVDCRTLELKNCVFVFRVV